MEIAKE